MMRSFSALALILAKSPTSVQINGMVWFYILSSTSAMTVHGCSKVTIFVAVDADPWAKTLIRAI